MSEKRDAYVEKLKAKLDEWNAEIDKLQAKADQASAEAEIEMQKNIEELKAQRAEARQKLDDLSRSGSGAWEDLKAGVDKAWHALGESIKSARSRFN
jgi:hypothetical protein